eukprot:CAMPEP_0195146894 /NCGR_PEP_ID=MMETSP0448-20130528/172397_1 /TAXON_ID=66468 /ORGANISM="Heterocapsa triquestra, Strain CCMP 448" /LENGTH=31 /DNA_ID= /DNA_START= /DNA_END= /DNA_ORIENTATION=
MTARPLPRRAVHGPATLPRAQAGVWPWCGYR